MSAIRPDAAIRPFRVNVPEEALVDLRRRLAQTRLPEKESVADFSQGFPLKTVQRLLHYWQSDDTTIRSSVRRMAAPLTGGSLIPNRQPEDRAP